ncbi:ISAs1 family transposase [Pseudomonas aeruginosa]|nr:ISAs1 family transposase [Pseudomonas aeruginosa]
MRQLKRLLRPLKDPRASNVRHDLVEIIVIALAATLAGAKTCTEFEFFGKGREELLQRFLELRSGIPSHDTFSNVFRALDPKGLEAILRKLSKGFGIKGVVSIDGKALRGAFMRGRQSTPLHMVNVWAAGTRMALAQRKAPNRNEVAGVLEVLASLDLDGALVTADALHCRPDVAQAIRDRKGHYVLAIKSNRG